MDMDLTRRLARRMPPGTVLVGESGIKTRDDVLDLGAAGAHAVLVGEALMRAPSPGEALRELLFAGAGGEAWGRASAASAAGVSPRVSGEDDE
jgi:indole-3-glycerol phosphate synthase